MTIFTPPWVRRGPDIDWADMERRGWRRRGEALVREFRFRDYEEAERFVVHMSENAVDYGRRPDMEIHSPNFVRLSIINPHHAGFTHAELRLAEKVDAVVDGS